MKRKKMDFIGKRKVSGCPPLVDATTSGRAWQANTTSHAWQGTTSGSPLPPCPIVPCQLVTSRHVSSSCGMRPSGKRFVVKK